MTSVLSRVRVRALMAGAVAVLGLSAACTEGRLPTEPIGLKPTSVSLSLNATVTASAARTMRVTASYARAAAPTALIALDSAAVTLSGGETDLPVRLDIAGCLADPARELPFGVSLDDAKSICILHITLSLYDANNRLIDRVDLAPLSVSPGVQATPPAVQIGTSVGSVGVTPKTLTLNAIGFSAALNAVVTDQNGQPIANPSLAWSSLSPAVATVDANTGQVTAKAVGTTKVVATSRTKSDTSSITVRQVVRTLAIAGVPATMIQNDAATATLTATDSNNTAIPPAAIAAQFGSSNPAVLTITPQGAVKALAPGTATITAQSGPVSATLTVTVNLATIAKIVVTPPAPSVQLPATQQFAAVAQDASGNVLTGRSITWTTSDPTVATVDANGLASTKKAGAVTVTASGGAVSGTATLTVTPSAVGSVTIAPAAPTLFLGSTSQLTATVKDAQGTVLTNQAITWTTSDNTVAPVDNAGLVSALKVGAATITATAAGVSGTATVTVVGGTISIVTQPGGGIAGSPISPQPVVKIVDANNQVVTTFNGPVSANLVGGTGSLLGNTTITAVSGVATFTNLATTAAGTFTLTFGTPISPNVSSAPFTVTAGSGGGATQLGIRTQPVGATSTFAFSPQPVVEIRDANNLLVSSASNTVTASLVTVSGSGALTGTTTATAVNGVATFTNLAINGTGQFRLNFTSGTLSSIQSALLSMSAATLAVTTHPVGGASGQPLATQPVFRITDVNGNVITSANLPVTVALNTSSGSGTLSGTTTVNAVNGVATFTNLVVTGSGTFTLSATAPNATSVITNPFSVLPPFLGLKVGASATGNATQGQNYAVPIIMDMSTANGQNIASLQFTLTYDATKFDYVSFTPGTFGSSNGSPTVNGGTPGQVQINMFDTAGFNSGTPTVITVVLLPKASSTGTPLTASGIIAGDQAGANISSKVSPRAQTVVIP